MNFFFIGLIGSVIILFIGVAVSFLNKKKHNHGRNETSKKDNWLAIIGIAFTIFFGLLSVLQQNKKTESNNNVEIETTRIVDTESKMIDTTLLSISSDSVEHSSVKTIESSEENTSQVSYQNDRIYIEKIHKAGEELIIDLRFDRYFNGEVSVTVPQDDICSLNNKGDFPQKLMGSSPTFCVKLKQKTNRDGGQNTSEFIIDAKSKYDEGSYSVVKKVDIQRCIVIH